MLTDKRVRYILFAVFIVVGLPLLYLAGENIKEDPSFCINCHLPSGDELHGKKYDRMARTPPEDLAGLHYAETKGKTGCYGCHRGYGLRQTVRVHWREFSNTIQHFVSRTEEPDEFDLSLMPNSNCRHCHEEMDNRRDREKFHGLAAHRGMDKVLCIKCHAAHVRGDGEYFFMEGERLLKACSGCHRNLSPGYLSVIPPRSLPLNRQDR